MARLLLLGILACAMLFTAPANAQRRTGAKVRKAQALVDRGDRLFDEKRYEQAIAEYTAALAIVSHPDLVWNIARAHQELKRHSQALAFFRQYRDMEVSAADRTAAGTRIVELNKAVEAAKRGRLVVTTPSAEATVSVGGVEVGRGKRVEVTVRPGRYRIRVDLAGYETFETRARVPPAGEMLVTAVLKRKEARAVLVVLTPGVDAASVSVDGGKSEPVGIPIPLRGGAHKLVITAPRYDTIEKLIDAPAGKKTTVTVDLGTPRAPVEYVTWKGEYRLFGRSDDAMAVAGGTLILEGRGTGRLSVPRRMALEKWRRSACDGAAEVTWTEVWAATLSTDAAEAELSLTGSRLEDCTCDVWCKSTGDLSLDAVPLPGREGLIGAEFVALRAGILQPDAGAFGPSGLEDLRGQWKVVRWSVAGGTVESLVVAPSSSSGARGVLQVRRRGMVPSYKRSACPGTRRYEQVVEYPVEVTVHAGAIRASFERGREASCSCKTACGTPPPLAAVTLRVLSVPRYAVGLDIVLRRVE